MSMRDKEEVKKIIQDVKKILQRCNSDQGIIIQSKYYCKELRHEFFNNPCVATTLSDGDEVSIKIHDLDIVKIYKDIEVLWNYSGLQ